jgi:alginate O-acetyltransferase complex protein AlgI
LSGHAPLPYINFLLPIGLSFHTFQAMSYTIEVYRKNYPAEKHFGIYALYVMFYPQLVAGPIERPQNILWQFHLNHKFDYEKLKSGLMQMAFGLFKKVVIADRIAQIVDGAYAKPGAQNGKTFFIITILYSFQIYCDFSGYSDIGIGAARTMGFKLVDNFNRPYFSRSLSEFWNRWHMSLSTWFKDYLYIPLGGSRVKTHRKYLNLLIVFLISGLWHGANWTFIVWGLLHGTFLIAENIKTDFLPKIHLKNNAVVRISQTVAVFLAITLLWIFFRAPDIHTALLVLQKISSGSITGSFNYQIANLNLLLFCGFLIVFMMVKEYFFLNISTKNDILFYLNISLLIVACYTFGVFNYVQFIYFQF